jgi:SAM-dependent methyltransferase
MPAKPGKYLPEYVLPYAALWGFGHETLHKGYNETLYRTIHSLVLECAMRTRPEIIVDAGCGVGRTTADCARSLADAEILAIDASQHMLAMAKRIVAEPHTVSCDLGDRGFGELAIQGRGCANVQFALADVTNIPLRDSAADLVLSVNIVDRLDGGPEAAFRECARVLRHDGDLVFCDPLNWQVRRWWETYATAESICTLIETCGFEIITWFDDLPYKEIQDSRGFFEEFQTLVVHARKK